MKYIAYSLRDKVSGEFRDLTLNVSDDVAKRDLSYVVNNDTRFQFMSKDFELYKLGIFDTKTGVFEQFNPIEMVVQADQLLGG